MPLDDEAYLFQCNECLNQALAAERTRREALIAAARAAEIAWIAAGRPSETAPTGISFAQTLDDPSLHGKLTPWEKPSQCKITHPEADVTHVSCGVCGSLMLEQLVPDVKK